MSVRSGRVGLITLCSGELVVGSVSGARSATGRWLRIRQFGRLRHIATFVRGERPGRQFGTRRQLRELTHQVERHAIGQAATAEVLSRRAMAVAARTGCVRERWRRRIEECGSTRSLRTGGAPAGIVGGTVGVNDLARALPPASSGKANVPPSVIGFVLRSSCSTAAERLCLRRPYCSTTVGRATATDYAGGDD